VKGRVRYLMIAALLTIFDGTVTVYFGMSNWKASSRDILDCGYWILFAALGASSLVNVWAQALQDSGVSFYGRSAGYRERAAPVPEGARGQGDV
jgi:hypothetical protein